MSSATQRVDRLQCVLEFLRDVEHFKKNSVAHHQQEVRGDAFHEDISLVKLKMQIRLVQGAHREQDEN